MDENEFYAALNQFTGTTQYFRHFSGMRYTDGVRYLAEAARCYWLLDIIASSQPKALRDPHLRQFQLWELQVAENKTATVFCLRDLDDLAFEETIPYSDFPHRYVRLYVESGVILLPSEH